MHLGLRAFLYNCYCCADSMLVCVCVCVCVYAGYIPQELLDVLKNLGEGVPDNLLDQLKQVAEPDDEQQVNIRHLVDILLKTAV